RTFRECALEYIAAHEDGWRGDRSRRQWIDSLTKHVFPKIGGMAIADVDIAAVVSVLDPIAKKIPETSTRIRNRISMHLGCAASRESGQAAEPSAEAPAAEDTLCGVAIRADTDVHGTATATTGD